MSFAQVAVAQYCRALHNGKEYQHSIHWCNAHPPPSFKKKKKKARVFPELLGCGPAGALPSVRGNHAL
jgi:hypothetical protein